MARQVEESVDLGDGDSLRPIGRLHDLVPSAYLTFLDYAEVEPWSLVGNEQCGHLRIVHPNADTITSDPRLGHFKQCPADPVAIPDADLVVCKTINGQILAELPILEIVSLKVCFPVAIGVELVHHHSSVLTTVPREISLAVAVDIETSHHHPSRHRSLPDRGAHHLALPLYIARKTNVHRDKRTHIALSCP
jgi:hypothetical protein